MTHLGKSIENIKTRHANNITPTYPNFMQQKSCEPGLGSIGWGVQNPDLHQNDFVKPDQIDKRHVQHFNDYENKKFLDLTGKFK